MLPSEALAGIHSPVANHLNTPIFCAVGRWVEVARKYNPFRPNSMVGPGMFVGRSEEIEVIEQCLYQAKNGNPQHFLVQGDDLVNRVSNFCGATKGNIDGIVILTDEADRPSPDAGLGAFLKLLSERLARRQSLNVLLGLAGLPTIIQKLRDSHESSPRLFETLMLDPLDIEERKQVASLP
jgi:hypothetical protein